MTTYDGRAAPGPLARAGAAIVAAAAVLALAGCSSGDASGAGPAPAEVPGSPSRLSVAGHTDALDHALDRAASTTPSTTPGPDDLRYVALGDSYAAAPGVPTTDPADGCYRSDHNYAHVVAATEADVFLTDMTCSGASSDDILELQVPALDKDTDLVTVGTGRQRLQPVHPGPRQLRRRSGRRPRGGPVHRSGRRPGRRRPATDPREDRGRARRDHRGRPPRRGAGHRLPGLLPASGTCPDLVPIAAGDYPFVSSVNERLSSALRDEAEQRDLTFVDVFAASAGHDVCSADPWVNGVQTAPDGTAPFHPFATEQAAVAAMISDSL